MHKAGATLKKVVLGVALVLAGALPSSAHGLTIDPYSVTMSDGTVLRGHVYLPDAPRPLATVLEFTPYFNQDPVFSPSGAQEANDRYTRLLAEGFAVALVNPRGSGDSDGCLDVPSGPNDISDAGALVTDLAAQEWSNGKVGMIGHSYPAAMQMAAAVAAPPALKALIPMSNTVDTWSVVTRRGAPAQPAESAFALKLAALTVGDDERILDRACQNLARSFLEGAELTTTGDRTPFWEARDLRDRLDGTKIPMMMTNGLLWGEGHVLQVDGVWDLFHADRTRLILGQWRHEQPDVSRRDWYDDVVGWFDHYLRGGPKTVPTKVVDYQDDAGEWQRSDRWPPKSTISALHLSGDSLVPAGAPVAPADASFVSADTDPGPGLGTSDPNNNPLTGPPVTTVAVCGPHQVLYISPPLTSDALVAGNFEVELTITSDQRGGNFSVFLWKTAGDGNCPDRAARPFGRAMMDLRHWAEAGRSQDFPIGRPTAITMTSHPLAARLREGERIVVAIGGGNVELIPDPLHPTITVHDGTFRLPVVDGDGLRFEGPALPAG